MFDPDNYALWEKRLTPWGAALAFYVIIIGAAVFGLSQIVGVIKAVASVVGPLISATPSLSVPSTQTITSVLIATGITVMLIGVTLFVAARVARNWQSIFARYLVQYTTDFGHRLEYVEQHAADSQTADGVAGSLHTRVAKLEIGAGIAGGNARDNLVHLLRGPEQTVETVAEAHERRRARLRAPGGD